mmetsp:Transcript_19133/g.52758  ORF Transcript_19133/g.52758 Transcript_19133/m.52758 type:complete len:147 (-) Transcript_19133:122-562(-)
MIIPFLVLYFHPKRNSVLQLICSLLLTLFKANVELSEVSSSFQLTKTLHFVILSAVVSLGSSIAMSHLIPAQQRLVERGWFPLAVWVGLVEGLVRALRPQRSVLVVQGGVLRQVWERAPAAAAGAVQVTGQVIISSVFCFANCAVN